MALEDSAVEFDLKMKPIELCHATAKLPKPLRRHIPGIFACIRSDPTSRYLSGNCASISRAFFAASEAGYVLMISWSFIFALAYNLLSM